MNEQQERSAFERWASDGWTSRLAVLKDSDDIYKLMSVQQQWRAWQARAALAANVPAGFAIVPLRMTQAMREVTDADDWTWEDLLAAAEAIDEPTYNALSEAAPAPEADLPNGLTEAETSASPSVAGLSGPAQAQPTEPVGIVIAVNDFEGRIQWRRAGARLPLDAELYAAPVAQAKPEAQQPLSDEQIMARKPVSADFVSFRAGVRCVEIERASREGKA